jgi:hypothetical protein
MRRSVVYMLGWAAAHVLGCKDEARLPGSLDAGVASAASADAGAQPARDAASPMQPESSQCDVAQCARQAQALAQELASATSESIAVKGGECTRVDIQGVVAGMACTCISTNGWLYIGPDGAGCFARGRAGDCLWDDTEFEACSEGDPACSAMCDELQKRYAADAAKSFDVEVRSSTCQDNACHHVLRIGDACYADQSFEAGRRFDCTLSDAEILERDARAHKHSG